LPSDNAALNHSTDRIEQVYLTEEQSNEDDFWQNDTNGRSQIFLNKAAKLDAGGGIFNPTNANHIGLFVVGNRRSSVVLPAQQTSDEMGINENGNCAKPAPAIDPNLGHLSQFFVLGISKL
jgi:hypothetical protein